MYGKIIATLLFTLTCTAPMLASAAASISSESQLRLTLRIYHPVRATVIEQASIYEQQHRHAWLCIRNRDNHTFHIRTGTRTQPGRIVPVNEARGDNACDSGLAHTLPGRFMSLGEGENIYLMIEPE